MWETNDDVGMSMAAHGYGMAAVSTPNIVFSNVLWGAFVRSIPSINGVLGYSSATLGTLILIGGVVLFSLYQLRAGLVTALCMLCLILTRPTLLPQFTINSGLLLIAALLCWHLYAQQKGTWTLWLGCLLAFLSYLIRKEEFLLVLAIALPLLPWRVILQSNTFKRAILLLIVAIVGSSVINHYAYQGKQWNAFNELKPSLAPLIDFGAGAHLKPRDDILDQHNFSANDIDLISNWFFVDPQIASPQTLQSMLSQLGPLPVQEQSLTKAWNGIKTLWHPNLKPLILAAIIILLLKPSWPVVASWGLFILAIFLIGLLGRPSVIRVYIPLVSLLAIAPFFLANEVSWRNHITALVLVAAAGMNATNVFTTASTHKATFEQTQKDLTNFPLGAPTINWGGGFPFEATYPVLGSSPNAMRYRFYGLGGFTLAPFSVPFAEEQKGRGLITQFTEEKGIAIMANERRLGYLDNYCRQRLNGEPQIMPSREYGALMINQTRCNQTK